MAYCVLVALLLGKVQVLGGLRPPNFVLQGMLLYYLMTLVLRKGSQIKVMALSSSHQILLEMQAAYHMDAKTWMLATKMSLDSVMTWVSQHTNELT